MMAGIVAQGGASIGAMRPLGFAKFTVPAATGNVDIVAPELGGTVPKLAIFFMSYHVAASDPGNSDGVMWAVSACDGTNEVYHAAMKLAGTAKRKIGTGKVCYTMDGAGTVLSAADLNSFIANGVRLNFTSAVGSLYTGIVWFFGGADVEAACGILDTDGGIGNRVVTGLGFQPMLLIAASGADSVAAGMGLGDHFSFGMTDGTSQRLSSISNNAPSPEHRQNLRDDGVYRIVSSASGNQLAKVGLGSLDSDGFTLAVDTDQPSARELIWIAVRMTGGAFKIISLDTPTSTGLEAYTGMGFAPDAVMGYVTTQQAINPANPIAPSSTLAGGSGYFSFDNAKEWAISYCHSNAAGAVEKCDLKAAALRLGDGTASGTGAVNATLDSLDADGFTLDYSAVLGAVKKGWALGVKAP